MIQSKYIKDILKTFGKDESRLVVTIMVIRCKLSKEDTTSKVNETLYISMIRKLQLCCTQST